MSELAKRLDDQSARIHANDRRITEHMAGCEVRNNVQGSMNTDLEMRMRSVERMKWMMLGFAAAGGGIGGAVGGMLMKLVK